MTPASQADDLSKLNNLYHAVVRQDERLLCILLLGID